MVLSSTTTLDRVDKPITKIGLVVSVPSGTTSWVSQALC